MSNFIKGTLFLTFSSFIAMAINYSLHFLLGRWLGPAEYGTFGIVLNSLNIVENIFSAGILLATSKFLAEYRNSKSEIVRQSIKLQIILFLPFSIIFLFFPHIVSNFFNDTNLIPLFQIVGIIIPLYAFRSLIQGLLNGLHEYKKQSLITLISALTKLFSIVIFYFYFLTSFQALLGYGLGALAGIILGMFLLPKIKDLGDFSFIKLLKSTIPLTLFWLIYPLFFSLDLFWIKRLIDDYQIIGFYTASSTLARVPYFLLNSLSLTMISEVSSYYGNKDFKKVKHQSEKIIVFLISVLLPITIFLFVNSKEILNFLFSYRYIEGAEILSILSIGIFFLSLGKIISNVLISIGKIWQTIAIISFSLFINFFSYYLFVSENFLIITYIMATTSFLVFIFNYLYLKHLLKIKINYKLILKILISCFVVFFFCNIIVFNHAWLIVEFLICSLFYLSMLIIFKIVSLTTIKKILKK